MAFINLNADSVSSFDSNRYFSKVRYYRLARYALKEAFACIQMVPGDHVLLPAFICKDLLAPIYAAGAVPVFYEVDRELRPIELPVDARVRAVVAVNYFGFPQNLDPFRLYCDRFGAVLIEDNAHGFLSSDLEGIPLGERGDFGIFSIRKTFALPDGAMLMANTAQWQSRMSEQLPFRHELLPPSFLLNYGLSWIERKTGIAVHALGQELIRKFRYLRTGHAIAPSQSKDEFEMPPDPAPHQVSMAIIKRQDVAEERQRRCVLYALFRELLSSMDITPLFHELPRGTVPYGYPFYADVKTAQQVASVARSQGFDCIHWPELPMAVEPEAPLHYRTLWLVNFLC
ncbi:MAG: hypothetical protein HGB35_00625 [Geobacteraceae bacterium]|nr:hypothetical protein [Geobacteraceae bacterium]